MLFLVNPFWITSAKYLTAGVGAFVVCGQAAAFSRALGLPAAAGAIVLSGKAAGLLYNRRVDAEVAAFALTGMQAQFIGAGRIMADPAAFVLSGQAANLRSARVLSAQLGSFALAGKDAALLFGKTLPAARGVFAISGNEAGLLRSLIASAGTGTFNVAGQDAGLLRALMLTASAGTYVLSGQAAALVRRFVLAAAPGAFTLAGQDVGLNRGRSLVATPAGFVLAGQDAGLTYTPSGITALSFVATASGGATGSGSVSVTIPAGAQAGDLCIWMQSVFGASVTNAIPGDFSSLDAKGISSTGFATQWAYKILDGADPGVSKTGGSTNTGGTMQRSAVALVFRPDRPISSVTLGAAINDQDTASNPTAQALNLSGNTSVLIAIAHMMGTGTVSPRTASPAMNEVQGGIDRHWVLHSLTAADYTIDMDDEGVNRLQSGYIVVT